MLASARARLALTVILPLVVLSAGPALATTLYFNSHGWDKIYRMNAASSQVELLPAADILETTFFKSADFASDNRLYGIGLDSLVAVDVSGPQTFWTEQYTITDGGDYLSFAPGDQLWVTSGSTLRQIAPGGATVPDTTVDVTYLDSALAFWGIDFAADGTLYAIDGSHLYRVNPSTGIATRIHSRPNLDGGIFTELDVAADGMIRMLGSFGYLYQYDPQADAGAWRPGELLYDGTSFSPSSLASPIPEPSSLTLLGLGGLVLLGLIARRPQR
ncbi:MAG: PEP-CTERM sorting domain-containing protein [Pirellulales bacterium]|nr:PEP-CTERM sorting domain-containing protein [Pirellulales bacterium]